MESQSIADNAEDDMKRIKKGKVMSTYRTYLVEQFIERIPDDLRK